MATVAIALNFLPVCLPVLRLGIGPGIVLSKEQLGRIAAMAFVGMVAGLLVSGPLANRLAARWFTTAGNFVLCAGLVVMGLSHSYAAVLMAAAMMGLGGGILDLVLSPIVCAFEPHRRAQAMNWLHSCFCLGTVLVVLGATVAFARSWSWHRVTFAMAVLPAVVAVAFLFVGHPDLRRAKAERLPVGRLLGDRYFLIALGAIFLAGGAEMGVAQWLPAYAELELGFSRWVGGTALLGFSLAMALGRMGAGIISARVPVQRLMAWSCGAAALSILLAGTSPRPGLSLGASIFAGFATSCLWPSTLGLAADRFPLAGASLFGVLAAIGNLGGVLVPWTIGIIGDSRSLGLGLAASALCPILILVFLSGMARLQPTQAVVTAA
jgi:fucose permease